MMHTAIYPGTFDPITYGHLDLIERATKLFDKLIIAVASAEQKQPLLSLAQRIDLCRHSLLQLDPHPHNIEICGFSDLLVNFAHSKGCSVILRGLRTMADFEYERQLAAMNQMMETDIETLFIAPAGQFAAISSSLVKEIASMQGNVDAFVPIRVSEALQQHYAAVQR